MRQLDPAPFRLSCSHRVLRGRGGWLLFPLMALAVVVAFVPSRVARADGGAPNLVYVAGAGSSGGDVAVVDIGKRAVTSRISVGGAPSGVVLRADARYAYVTQSARNQVAVIDTHGGNVTQTIGVGHDPTAIAIDVSYSTQHLYVVNTGSDSVSILDPDANRVLATVPVGRHPSGVGFAAANSGIPNPDDPEVFVANTASNTVSVISTARRQVEATIPVPGGPVGVVIPGGGGIAYVSTQDGTIEAVSLSVNRVLGTVLRVPGAHFGTMDYDAVTGEIYVPDGLGAVDVLRPVSASADGTGLSSPHEPERVLHVGGEPSAVAITFEGSYGFVARRASGSVALLDAGSHTLLANVAVGGAPVALVTGAYPPAVSNSTAFLVDMGVVVLVVALGAFAILDLRRARRRQAKATDTTSQ